MSINNQGSNGFSPVYISYEECIMHSLFDRIHMYDCSNPLSYLDYSKDALNNYFMLNYQGVENFETQYLQTYNCIDNNGFKKQGYTIESLTVNSDTQSYLEKPLKIATVNIEVENANIKAAINNVPNLSKFRMFEIRKLLNAAIKEHCDLIIFPEASIPLNWLRYLVNFSKANKIAIIGGFEPSVNRNNYAMNLLFTLLPYTIKAHDKPYNSTLLITRLKNYYSQNESNLIKKLYKKVPKLYDLNPVYNIFNYNGARFSYYTSTELENADDRLIFNSQIDFMIASNWNSDSNNFSDIIESSSKELNSYIVNINASQCIDTTIVAPEESVKAHTVNIKSTETGSILLSTLDISGLRSFQQAHKV